MEMSLLHRRSLVLSLQNSRPQIGTLLPAAPTSIRTPTRFARQLVFPSRRSRVTPACSWYIVEVREEGIGTNQSKTSRTRDPNEPIRKLHDNVIGGMFRLIP